MKNEKLEGGLRLEPAGQDETDEPTDRSVKAGVHLGTKSGYLGADVTDLMVNAIEASPYLGIQRTDVLLQRSQSGVDLFKNISCAKLFCHRVSCRESSVDKAAQTIESYKPTLSLPVHMQTTCRVIGRLPSVKKTKY